jgi:hypothetical protein
MKEQKIDWNNTLNHIGLAIFLSIAIWTWYVVITSGNSLAELAFELDATTEELSDADRLSILQYATLTSTVQGLYLVSAVLSTFFALWFLLRLVGSSSEVPQTKKT